MAQALRDTPAGHLLRLIGFRSYLSWPEEAPNFEPRQMPAIAKEISSSSDDLEKTLSKISARVGTKTDEGSDIITNNKKLSRKELADAIVVTFAENDQDNPRNWPQRKKTWTLTLVNVYTFVVYLTASIITPDVEFIMQRYNVSIVVASLGLSMYVVGCKCPCFWLGWVAANVNQTVWVPCSSHLSAKFRASEETHLTFTPSPSSSSCRSLFALSAISPD